MNQNNEVAPRLICGNRTYSSWSLRGWLSLRKSGVDPDVTVLPMDTPEFYERIATLSPTGRVPVLWLGDEAVWDSLAIAETANERFADGRLWPTDPAQRALARSMAAEMHSGFSALREHLPMNCRAQQRAVEPPSVVDEDVMRICSLWQSAKGLSESTSGWLFSEVSIADIMFAPVAIRFNGYRLNLPESAQLYVEHWLNDADLQQWLQDAALESWVIDHEEVGRDATESN